MDTEFVRRQILAWHRDSPPKGHRIERIEVEAQAARLYIVPKIGFAGEPRVLNIRFWDEHTMLLQEIMRAGFFTRIYQPSTER